MPSPAGPASEPVDKKTFCGICEASCGLIATVHHDRVIDLKPDPDHPSSRGFACPKGVAFAAVVEDPDRVLHPMRRLPDGSFVRATWDEALDDIGRRLKAVQREHGNGSIGVVIGNPVAWNFEGAVVAAGLAGALGTKHQYQSSSVDINNYFAAADILYGAPLVNPMPDFATTDFALLVGTNPVVSHGSMVNTGRIRDVLVDIPARGGRVVVVDPRRSETAQLFEHVPIRPGADPWLLGGLLRVLFDDDLVDTDALARQTTGADELRAVAGLFDLDRAAQESGVPVETISELAHALAAATTACVYGRCGASLGRFSTLTKALLDLLNIVTGNMDRRGGLVFGHSVIDPAAFGELGAGSRGAWRTRVHGVGELNGTSPMACMPEEITTPGEGQLRALIGMSSNMVNSSPGSAAMSAALDQLDLMVWLDPYLTETARHAHWVLPPTLWLEREHMPIFTQGLATVPNTQWVAPVVPARGEARDDAWILDQFARSLGVSPLGIPGAGRLAKLGIRPRPRHLIDLALRLGPYGDRYGLRRGGLSRKKLLATQGAVKIADECPTGVLEKWLRTPDKRIRLDHPELRAEVQRLLGQPDDDAAYPLRLFSVRELRSHNSWLQNVPRLMVGDRRCRAFLSPHDAAAAGVHDRDEIRLTSPWGRITVPVEVTDEVARGSVGLTHGWGHSGGWRTAVAGGGASYNELTPADPAESDQPSGNAFINGIPVFVSPATVAAGAVR